MLNHHEELLGQLSHPITNLVRSVTTAGCRIAYRVPQSTDPMACKIFVDGKETPVLDEVYVGPLFSLNADRVAFVAQSKRVRVAVVDGVRPWMEEVHTDVSGAMGTVFSGDCSSHAYPQERNGKWVVVHDGEYNEAYDSLFERGIRLSRTGERIAYVAGKAGSCLVVASGLGIQDTFDNVPVDTLSFSADGSRLAYGALRRKKWLRAQQCFVVVDGVASPPIDDIAIAPTFSPDSKRCGYGATSKASHSVVVDGEGGPQFEGVAGLTFSANGASIAYGVKTGIKWAVAVDHKPGEWHKGIKAPLLAPRGKRVMYSALLDNGQWTVCTEGKRGPTFDNVYDSTMTFSDDGAHFGYFASSGESWTAVIDGQRFGPYAALGRTLAFSPDGRHVAYAAKTSSGMHMLIDGEVGPEYEEIQVGPVFRADGVLEYLAVRSSTLLRVTHQLSPTARGGLLDRGADKKRQSAFSRLLTQVLGDSEKAERLIEYERKRNPGASEIECIEAASRRIEEDNTGRWS